MSSLPFVFPQPNNPQLERCIILCHLGHFLPLPSGLLSTAFVYLPLSFGLLSTTFVYFSSSFILLHPICFRFVDLLRPNHHFHSISFTLSTFVWFGLSLTPSIYRNPPSCPSLHFHLPITKQRYNAIQRSRCNASIRRSA